MLAFLLLRFVLRQRIFEEKHFQNGKHNEQLHQNYDPQRLTPCQIFEAVNIHHEKITDISYFFHRHKSIEKF